MSEIASEVTAAEPSGSVSGASSPPISSVETTASSPASSAEVPSDFRGKLKQALAPDAGKPAAPVPTAAQQSETDRKAWLAQAQGEIDRKFGHLTKIDPKVLKAAIEHSTQLSNPQTRAGFIASLVGEIMQNPTEGAALKGLLSSHFAAPPPVTAPADDAEPQIFVQDENGEIRIDPRKLAEREAWRDRQVEKRLSERYDKEIAPLKKTAEDLKLQKQADEIDRQVTTWTGNILGYIKTLPDYESNRAEIAKAFDEDVAELLEKNPQASPESIENVAIKAYNRVTAPKAAQSAEARVQATLKAKAEGRTASPNGNQRSSVVAKDAPEGERLRAALKKELFPDAG